jgi:hypothetical protein
MLKRNLNHKYYKSKLAECNAKEGQFEDEPNLLQLCLLGSLVGVELSMTIVAGWSAGWAILFLAPFPIVLLAGSAWVVANSIDLPEKCAELKAEYALFPNSNDRPEDRKTSFDLIPDRREFRQAFIDLYLDWLSGAHANISSENELNRRYQLQYYQQRMFGLEAEYYSWQETYTNRYKADVQSLQQEADYGNPQGIPEWLQNSNRIAILAERQVRLRESHEGDLAALERNYLLAKEKCSAEIERLKVEKEYRQSEEEILTAKNN